MRQPGVDCQLLLLRVAGTIGLLSAIMCGAGALAGCGGDTGPTRTAPVATTNVHAIDTNLRRLRARIKELGGGEAYPVVPLALFHDINRVRDS